MMSSARRHARPARWPTRRPARPQPARARPAPQAPELKEKKRPKPPDIRPPTIKDLEKRSRYGKRPPTRWEIVDIATHAEERYRARNEYITKKQVQCYYLSQEHTKLDGTAANAAALRHRPHPLAAGHAGGPASSACAP